MSSQDTIFALTSPSGPAARMILRVSGPAAFDAIGQLASAPVPRRRGLLQARLNLAAGALSARATLWRFPGPRSFTGEDLIEVQLPGSPALLEVCQQAFFGVGLREAGPGEFSQRAFLAGRIDLSRAEATMALIHAAGEGERQAALSALDGALARFVHAERERLLRWLVPIELALDFADQDIDIPPPPGIAEGLQEAGECLRELGRDVGLRVLRRSRQTIVLNGPANAGKSSLFNRLAGREESIVASVRGTTRDVVRAERSFDGIAAILCDVAGHDVSDSAVDELAHGQRRAALREADLVLEVRDGRADSSISIDGGGPERLLVLTHADQVEAGAREGDHWVSSTTGWGIDALRAAIGASLRGLGGAAHRLRISARHARAFADAADAIDRARAALQLGDDTLLASDLREAARQLDRIAGGDSSEQVLDRIFAGFCIGK